MPIRPCVVSIITLIALSITSAAMAQDTKDPSNAPVEVKKPSLIGLEQDGIHTTTYNSIMKCNVELRSSLAAPATPLRVTGVALAKGVSAPLKVTKAGLSYEGSAIESISFDSSRKLWLNLKGKKAPVAAPQGRYELSASTKMREIISLHIGQAGTQIGKATCEPKDTCGADRVEAALGKQPN